MKRISSTDLGPVKLLGFMEADLERVEEVFGKPPSKEKTWYVEFSSGIRARVSHRLDELHVHGSDADALEEVANVLEEGSEYKEEPETPPLGAVVGGAVVKHDPSILCREDTFKYIVTLDAIRRKHKQLPSWIRITTITMTCKFFATSRIDLELIREAFRERGTIRIRRKGALFNGHEWRFKETTFYNQVTVEYRDQYSTKSIKVFPNGSFQVCGCSDLYDCQRITKQLAYLMTDILKLETPLTHSAFKVAMINTNFSMNKPINQLMVVENLGPRSKFDVSFKPENYSAVKIKFKPRPEMKQVTASVFSTGKVIVTGAETLKEIVFAYDTLNTELDRFTYDVEPLMKSLAETPDLEQYYELRDQLQEALGYYLPKRLEDIENLDQLVESEGLQEDHLYQLIECAKRLTDAVQKNQSVTYDTVFGAKFGAWVKTLTERGVKEWV